MALDIDAGGIGAGASMFSKGLSFIVNLLSPYTLYLFYGGIGFFLFIKFIVWVKKKNVIRYEEY